MSKFKCNITYKKVEGNSLLSTQNKLRAHGFVDQYWNVKVDVATWRDARSELNELASAKLGSKVNLFEEKKLLNGIRAVPVVKYFSMLDRMRKTFHIPISEGISAVYDSNKELQTIGTKQEYANYVNSIFPNSKIKGVVYHSSNNRFDNFSENENGIHFGDISQAKTRNTHLKAKELNLYPSILNITKLGEGVDSHAVWDENNNPITTDKKQVQDFKSKGFDGYFYSNLIESEEGDDKSYVVFNSSQIHILGNKIDIENFSKWNQKYQPQFVRDEIGIDQQGDSIIEDIQLDTKPIETTIYESIGQRKNSIIKEENISNVRKQIEEFNSKAYGKKLSLVEVNGGWIINSTFTSNYLYKQHPQLEDIKAERKDLNSNNNFNLKCITG